MVGQLRSNRFVREFVGVNALFSELSSVFPDRVVAGHEYDTALLQGRDRVACRANYTRGVLMGFGVSRRWFFLYQPVGLEVATGHLTQLILFPDGLIVER